VTQRAGDLLGDAIVEIDDEKQAERRARKCLEEAKTRHWPSVEKFSGTQLHFDDDHGWISLRAVTNIGDQTRILRLDPVSSNEVDDARAEALVLTLVEWVSEQHRA
jgi:hypothetical protein